MEYLINRENYHRFDVIEVNKLPPRSYFIPFTTREQADSVSLGQKRYASSKVRVLSGQWDFKFYPRPCELPLVLSTDEVTFDTVDVPSCWQFRGYDRPFYINTRYQFPFDPPHIPMEDPVGTVFSFHGSDLGAKPRWQKPEEEYNFVGVYRKKLTLEGKSLQRVISFLGVASCLDLYVNGRHVGYSEGSHNTAEFDLTGYLQEGENELLAVVRRWCTGTYLECQDMFRNNGIFRDVLLYELEEGDIWDVTFTTQPGEEGYRGDVAVQLTGNTDVTVTLSGHGLERSFTCHSQKKAARAVFENLPVAQWNAEKPVLYDLYVETETACVKLRVGFKSVRIDGTVFTLNGSKVKLHGVNHHDTSCRNGYTLSADEIEADVRLAKAYNMDTIRTSHYPPDPLFLEWCDELGIYVVDEADLETHGTFTQQLPPTYNTISHDKRWAGHYLDRVCRLYGRDKNHVSVLMWSLGNEAGGYHNTDLMYHWLKNHTDLPVHYESVIHSRRVAYDVGSEMYPSVEKVIQVGQKCRREKPLNDRPYFLCEYAHAMGVGPGAAEEYWQAFYQYDNLMGGCVWEMVDHAVLHEDGSYTYGGDHGEWAHDGNFCVDGLFYPDRTPSTGAKLIRHIYRPLRIRHVDGCRYAFFNTMSFTNSDVFDIRFCCEGGRVAKFSVSVPPLTEKILRIPTCPPSGPYLTAAVTVRSTGEEVSREQLVFDIPVRREVQPLSGLPHGLSLENGRIFASKDGKRLCVSDPYTVLFRAPTDNDVDFAGRTAMDAYLDQTEQIVSTRVSPDSLTVENRITCRAGQFLCTDVYERCSEGILVTSRLRCVKGKGKLPRFGKAFRLDASFDRVEYLGRNGESYCDMKAHTQIASVSCGVSDMTEPNIRPQESGNRCDCTYAAVSDGSTAFAFTAVDKPFELGIKPYSDRELLTMRHREDEAVSGTYITLSAFQMGIGTGSCGPATRPEYCYDATGEYTLRFIIS